MSDLVGNPEDRFSHNEAHLCHVKDCEHIHVDLYELEVYLLILKLLQLQEKYCVRLRNSCIW